MESRPLPILKGKIEFKHVWFGYNGEDWVLKDISFTVNPGETVLSSAQPVRGRLRLLIC